jgi:predicted DNA-binding transcriptional regulator AlpA
MSYTEQTIRALEGFDILPASAVVRRPVIQALWGGITEREVYRCMGDGRIPKPVKLGRRDNGWIVGEVREALAALKATPERGA